jgi:2-polyprenyl-6-methoxyphenol hydroxylase-like FAD-dependent oxidoreductase
MATQEIETRCCIAGGGPAGMMLGFLLARAGLDVVVLEKWPDFLRDFRGDTIHPSTLTVLDELGLLQEAMQLEHSELRELQVEISGQTATVADFSRLGPCSALVLMPQWDLLNFLAKKAERYPGFHLMMQTEVTDLLTKDGAVVGVKAKSPRGEVAIRSELVVGADGRHSTVRQRSGLRCRNFGAPMDVLWFRLSRQPTDAPAIGRADDGKILVTIDRGDYWQCGVVIKKGGIDAIRAGGLDAFRASVAALAPFAAGRTEEIASWDDVKLLSVAVDRLDTWYRPGLLCIGDAAHAMSPIGGVGINLAIQDAVAAANLLIPKFKLGTPREQDLAAVQRRREPPAHRTQKLQLFIQNNLIEKVLSGRLLQGHRRRLPFALRLLQSFPILRRIPARVVGIGFRPEHVET